MSTRRASLKSENWSTSKAFVDTTVLADVLLAKGPRTRAAKLALARYSETQLPVYAIKELKAGALRNYAWAHNKLVETGSLSEAMEIINRVRGYRAASAHEALKSAAASWGFLTTAELQSEYGKKATLDSITSDFYRLHIKRLVVRAWQRRRRVTTKVVVPLPCYTETDPIEEREVLAVEGTRCNPQPECSLAPALKARLDLLERLRAVAKAGTGPEDGRRSKALRSICKRPQDVVTEEVCRNLGDAFFAFFAPSDTVILTTNKADHEPLAAALDKVVEVP
jgi:hypothetical protein